MTRWQGRWSRVRDVWRRSRLDGDIDDELRFHIDEEMEAGLRAGLTPGEARRAAEESLGAGPLAMREQILDARGATALDEFTRDVRHAVRFLVRNPGFAAVVLATLAVAIGAAVAAFSVTDAWLFRALRFPAADRLVVAFAAAPARPTEPAVWMPYRAYRAWQKDARSFASVSGAFFHGATYRTATDAMSIVGMRVTPEFFDTFATPPLRGRGLTRADVGGPDAVVISHGFWQRVLGGSDNVVGTTLTLSEVPYTVVGIMPPAFDVRLLDQAEGAAFWTLLGARDPGYGPDGAGPVAIVARMRAGVTIAAARAEAAAITRRAESAYAQNFNQFIVNLSSLQADNTRSVRVTLVTVLAAAICLLLIAAINVGALLLSRGLARRSEVAIRHALGAARARLVRQFLTESFVLSVCGGALGLGLATMATRLFLAWNPLGTLPANGVQLDLRALAAAAIAMTLTTVVSGLVPALQVSSGAPAEALRSGGQPGRFSAPMRRAQNVLLAAQVAVSVVLLVCSALLARTFIQLRSAPLGFAFDDLTVATVVLPRMPFDSSAARNAYFARVEARLLALPGVAKVAASTTPPLVGGGVATVNLTAADSMSAPRISLSEVTPGFFDALAVPLLAGRFFDRQDSAHGVPVVILNARAAADLFGSPAAAVGQRLRLNDEPWRQVAGVVGNVRTTFFNTLEWRIDPAVYRPAAQGFSQIGSLSAASFSLFVHIRVSRPLPAAEIRQAALHADPTAAVVDVRRLPAMVADATRQPTFRMTLLLWFGGLTLLLAAIGVYGLVAQTVNQRLREIAVRMALGAAPRTVMAALVRGTMAASLAGLAAGIVAALGLAQSLQGLLYGVQPRDSAALVGAGGLLLAVTGVAALVPALRATRVDPVRVLRGE